MIEELENYEELIKENEKLMKKSLRMIISFFTVLLISITLFVFLQSNKFFIFNLNRTFENTPSPLIAEIFSVVFFVIIIVALISYFTFSTSYFERRHQNIEQQIDTIDTFRKKYNLADIFSVVPIFLVVVMIINGFFFSFASVDGRSMEPTFCEFDAVVIRYVNDYESQDIVIVAYEEIYLIKRLVGMPGDRLVVNSNGVYIVPSDVLSANPNGVDYNEYRIEDNVDDVTEYLDLIIPDNQYYIMGDNRDNSTDSRKFGLVVEEQMLGKVILKISSSTCDIG